MDRGGAAAKNTFRKLPGTNARMSKYIGESLSIEDLQKREMEELAKKHGVDLDNPGQMVDSKDDDGEEMVMGTSTKVTVDELAEMAQNMTIDKRNKKKARVALQQTSGV